MTPTEICNAYIAAENGRDRAAMERAVFASRARSEHHRILDPDTSVNDS